MREKDGILVSDVCGTLFYENTTLGFTTDAYSINIANCNSGPVAVRPSDKTSKPDLLSAEATSSPSPTQAPST